MYNIDYMQIIIYLEIFKLTMLTFSDYGLEGNRAQEIRVHELWSYHLGWPIFTRS